MKQRYSKFKGYLVENNIHQKEIAKIINVSQATFSKRINGRGGDFTVQDLKQICTYLNIKAEIFFN